MKKNTLLIIGAILLGIGLLFLYLHKNFVSKKQEVELIKRVDKALSKEKEIRPQIPLPEPLPELEEELAPLPEPPMPVETKPITPPKESEMTKEERTAMLVKKIDSDDWDVQDQAADELIKIGKDSVPELIEALSDASIATTGTIAYILGRIGGPQATEAVKEMLNHENAIVRTDAVKALGEIGDIKAEDVLISSLSDTDGTVRLYAGKALGKLKSEKAVEPLINIIDRKEEESVNLAAIKALGELKDKRATPKLLKELEAGRDFFYKNEVVYALGEIGDERALSSLNNHLDILLENEPTEKNPLFHWRQAVRITEEAIHKIEEAIYE